MRWRWRRGFYQYAVGYPRDPADVPDRSLNFKPLAGVVDLALERDPAVLDLGVYLSPWNMDVGRQDMRDGAGYIPTPGTLGVCSVLGCVGSGVLFLSLSLFS
jgi:hypothetical protein